MTLNKCDIMTLMLDSASVHKGSTSKPSAAIINGGLTWRQPAFWRNIFLYYWFFSLFGHILEVFWAWVISDHANPGHIPTIAPLAPPYGLGIIALILIVWPIYKRFRKMNILLVFLLSTIVTTAVEYLCATAVVAVLGSNPFWDYSFEPFNFQGHICLQNSILLGLTATLFLRFAFPHIENLIQKISKSFLDDLFILLCATYTADVLFMIVKWLANW